jgi:hypothetical protein
MLRIVERHTAVELVKEKIGFGDKLLESHAVGHSVRQRAERHRLIVDSLGQPCRSRADCSLVALAHQSARLLAIDLERRCPQAGRCYQRCEQHNDDQAQRQSAHVMSAGRGR